MEIHQSVCHINLLSPVNDVLRLHLPVQMDDDGLQVVMKRVANTNEYILKEICSVYNQCRVSNLILYHIIYYIFVSVLPVFIWFFSVPVYIIYTSIKPATSMFETRSPETSLII